MGEYAIRATDHAEVKIGTCENMYYLRLEDRHKVLPLNGNVDPRNEEHALQIRFRLPFPDEDCIQIGEYKDHDRGFRLWKKSGEGRFERYDDFEDASTADDAGIIQLSHTSGLLVNVPCYHGQKLPDAGKDVRVFWNGKTWHLELYQLALRKDSEGATRVYPIVHCRFCGHLWRYEWADVREYIHGDMLDRLRQYMPAEEKAA
jgi:hypothetical protein